jgi:hypothetical protein
MWYTTCAVPKLKRGTVEGEVKKCSSCSRPAAVGTKCQVCSARNKVHAAAQKVRLKARRICVICCVRPARKPRLVFPPIHHHNWHERPGRPKCDCVPTVLDRTTCGKCSKAATEAKKAARLKETA